MDLSKRYEIAEGWDWHRWRHEARNLWFFESVILAEGWKMQYHNFGQIQRDMCDHLQDEDHLQKYLSAYRGSFKTTCLEGFFDWTFCWALAENRADGIIYNTATKPNAQIFQSRVKHDLLDNPLLKWIFPELPKLEKQYDKMTMDRIQYREVVMDFASTESILVSRHFPKWCNDDLENDKNTETETAREKLKRDWQYQKAITTKIPGKALALEIETGTPYHFDGLIWDIKSNPRYNALEIPCWTEEKDEKGQVTRKLTFPEYHSFEYFENKRAQMKPGIFAAQYLLQPIDEEDALCKSAWMKHWVEKDLPTNRYRTMVIDAGGSDPTVSDATAVTVVDHDALGNMYIIFAKEYFLTPGELMDWIPIWKKDFTPDETRIEKERASTTIADLFKHRFVQMGIFYVEHRNRSKTSRIWKMRQYFESKQFLFGPNMEELEMQALRWHGEGTLKRDDLLDSLAYHIDIKKPPTIALPHRLPSGRIFEPKTNSQFDEEIERVMRAAEQREVNYQQYCDRNF